MLTDTDRARLAEIAAMTDDHKAGWTFFHFRHALELGVLGELLRQPEVRERATWCNEVFDDIRERTGIESVAMLLPLEEIQRLHPEVAELMVTMPAKTAFVRMMAFCGNDAMFLAAVTAKVLAARRTNGEKVFIPHRHYDDWEDQPRNRECFTLACMAYYTQVAPTVFRQFFLPGVGVAMLACTGSASISAGRSPRPPAPRRPKPLTRPQPAT